MALLPPAPTNAAPGSFVWTQFFQRLQRVFSEPNSISWTAIDKNGSSLADLDTKNHSSLDNVLGTGQYHVSMSEAANLTALPDAEDIALNTVYVLTVDPTTSEIANGQWALFKNTTSGLLKLWSNDGGVLKSVTLT